MYIYTHAHVSVKCWYLSF